MSPKNQYEQMVLDYLEKFRTADRRTLEEYLIPHMPEILNDQQKINKVRNIISGMSNKKMIKNKANSRKYAIWTLPTDS